MLSVTHSETLPRQQNALRQPSCDASQLRQETSVNASIGA
jgi:hypothetical protein